MYIRKNIYDLPEVSKNIRHVSLTEINELYELYEDGRIYSRSRGLWLKTTYVNGIATYGLTVTKNKRASLFSRDFLIRKYIYGMPEFDYVQHTPLKGNEEFYQVYSDGRVFSKRTYQFLEPKKTKSNWKLVCILDKGVRRRTLYCARAVWESFVGPIGPEYKLQFLDEDRQNCCLENLNLVMKQSYTK